MALITSSTPPADDASAAPLTPAAPVTSPLSDRRTCPTCLHLVDRCDRCGQSLTGSRWASDVGPAGHEHYHARCLSADHQRADLAPLASLFADWERTRR